MAPSSSYQRLNAQKQAALRAYADELRKSGATDDEIVSKLRDVIEDATPSKGAQGAILKALRNPGKPIYLAGGPSAGASLEN